VATRPGAGTAAAPGAFTVIWTEPPQLATAPTLHPPSCPSPWRPSVCDPALTGLSVYVAPVCPGVRKGVTASWTPSTRKCTRCSSNAPLMPYR